MPTPWRVIGNSTGVGVSKTKIFEPKYEAKLEFWNWWGVVGSSNQQLLTLSIIFKN